ncbi:hypothetical protein [Hymenobacter sp. CRA2]|uniref:hypothetical protein n=1 Tax=Hymenobacter sp. CRA2 TaxID=1955620 RepID=UPI000990292F|nr:hypothetical protein [Hymenobacter sp. CRA2]OON65254.1 hypothetical protein B0919_24510 [Hymenobacter sp. CRA2]
MLQEADAYITGQLQRERAVQQAIHEEEQRRRGQAAFNAEFAAANQALYRATLQQLQGMLDGRQPAHLRRAVFLTENAYLNGQLRYADFSTQVDELVQLCRGLAADSARPNPTARFMALHRLMTDTVRVAYAGQLASVHLPPRYDFQDFWGRQDYTKQFVTKLLRTNSGQCHSLPLLYKLVADGLGIRTYLSMAPNHSYIQVLDNQGELYSYEPTNGHFVSDAYYMSSGFIKAGALKQRAYLDTLTQRETLAGRVFDLAQSYARRYGHDAFTAQCAALGLRYYPQSVQGRMLAHDAALMALMVAVKANGQPTEAQARLNPKLRPLMEEVERRKRAVAELGHEDMPAEQYARWLQQVEQEQARVAGQQAASRFAQTAQN